MLDKKLIQLIFLFQFKMGHKAAETTCNINNTFGQGSANECTVQRWFKKFCKGDESLEDEECSGQPSEIDNDNWEPSLKLILTTTWEVDEELNINHFNVMQLLKQIGKVKRLPKCEPQWADQKSKKSSFWSVISPYFMQQQIISWLDCNRWWEVDFIQLAMTSSVPGQRSSSKALPKAKLIPKKGNGHCLVVCCPYLIHYSFLNRDETITSEKYAQQIDVMHQKLQCLQLVLVKRKAPILCQDNTQPHVAQPILQKLNKLGCEVLPHLPYSSDPLPSDYHFLKKLRNFYAGKMLPQPVQDRKCFPRVHRILKHRFFTL